MPNNELDNTFANMRLLLLIGKLKDGGRLLKEENLNVIYSWTTLRETTISMS